MVKRLLILFVIIPLIYGCRQTDEYRQLVVADSLLRQELVDSALQKLRTIDIDSTNSELRAYYILLRTQALYKSYQPITSDSDINISYDHYKVSGDKEKLARTLLYRGNVRIDMGKTEEAIEDYKMAERLLTDVDDEALKHNVLFVLSHVYSTHSEYSLAIDYLRKAKDCAIKAGRNDYLVYDNKLTSIVYYKLAQYDSSYYYINKSIDAIYLLPEEPAKNRAHIWTDLGVTCYMMNDLEKAKQALEKSISIVPLGSAYATLARISLKKKDTTEAIRLLEEGLKVPDTKDADIDIVNLLSSIELNRGNYQHAAELSRRAYTLKDSMVKRQQEENVKAVQIEYDRKTEAEQSVIVRRWLWTGIGVVALTGGIVVAILIRRSRREKQQLAEERQRVEQLSEEGRKVNKELTKAIGKVEQMKRIRHEQDKAISSQQREWQQLGKAMAHGHRLFMELTGGGNIRQWTSADFKDFRIYYDCVDSTFAETIAQNYDQLSPNLYLLSVLEHLGKSDEYIMTTMGLTLGALRTTRSRLNQKQKDA